VSRCLHGVELALQEVVNFVAVFVEGIIWLHFESFVDVNYGRCSVPCKKHIFSCFVT